MKAIFTKYLFLSRMRYMFRHFLKAIIKHRYKNNDRKNTFPIKKETYVLITTPTRCTNFTILFLE